MNAENATRERNSISIPYCGECRICCKRTPLCICDFPFLKGVAEGHFSSQSISSLVICEIEEEIVEYAARNLWHLFSSNLLAKLTLSANGKFRFLAIPRHSDPCPFLTPAGCDIPLNKPLVCRLFPFNFLNNRLSSSPICPHATKMPSDTVTSLLFSITAEYGTQADLFRSDYAQTLQMLEQKYSWQTIYFH